jgi:predicted DNA-binding ribbon-helix-helix protein
MASKEYQRMQHQKKGDSENIPKSKQLTQMLSFRVVQAYLKEIEKVADKKKVTVSKLIRTYIKEGMKRDKELDSREENEFRVE